jgi:hypothetical protein
MRLWITLIFAIMQLPVVMLATSTVRGSCLNNLRILMGAKDQLQIEQKLAPGEIVEEAALSPYLKRGELPQCPDGGHYTIGSIGVQPVCSILGHSEADVERETVVRAARERVIGYSLILVALFIGGWLIRSMRVSTKSGSVGC